MAPTLASPIERLLTPLVQSFSVDAARTMADYELDSESERRLAELAEKANEGLLTADERDEYQQFGDIIDVITLLQIKSRQRLSQNPS